MTSRSVSPPQAHAKLVPPADAGRNGASACDSGARTEGESHGSTLRLAAKEDVLIAIRKIIRATDIHSRRLTKTVGLTAPQLLVLQAIRDLGAVAISRLSSEVSLSQATVTTIIDRLEKRGYVARSRSAQDKRVVHALLTDAGREAVERAPTPLQESFSVRFEQLPEREQLTILAALRQVAAMMGAEELDASPFLEVGDLTRYDE